MSILGSAFGRGLAGGAAAAGDLASRYIDETLAKQRAQALADIQHSTMVRSEDYMQSPDVQVRRRENERALLSMRGEEGLKADVAKAASSELQDAQIAAEKRKLAEITPAQIEAQNAVTSGTSQAKIDADLARMKAVTPQEVARARALAEATHSTAAKYRDQGQDVQSKISQIENALGRPLNEQEKMGVLGLIKNGRDPELDTETVTEEKMNPDGTVVKTQRKQVRRPGAERADEKPSQESAHAEAMAAIRAGAPADAVNKRLVELGYSQLPDQQKTRRDEPKRRVPASTEMLTEREWDRRFGKGDFKRQGEYGIGEDAMRAF